MVVKIKGTSKAVDITKLLHNFAMFWVLTFVRAVVIVECGCDETKVPFLDKPLWVLVYIIESYFFIRTMHHCIVNIIAVNKSHIK